MVHERTHSNDEIQEVQESPTNCDKVIQKRSSLQCSANGEVHRSVRSKKSKKNNSFQKKKKKWKGTIGRPFEHMGVDFARTFYVECDQPPPPPLDLTFLPFLTFLHHGIVRPCAFFLCFSLLFLHQTYTGARKKQNVHALKIGTFRGKWTFEWVFKTSYFFRLALCFLINSKLAFSLHVSQRCLTGTAKKMFDLERRTVQKITFCLFVWKPL